VKKILVIDNDPKRRQATVRDLKRKFGQTVMSAIDANDAIALLGGFQQKSHKVDKIAERDRLGLLMEHMQEPLFEFDLEGRISLVNKCAQIFANVPRKTLLSKNFFELFHKDHVPRIRDKFRDLQSEGTIFGNSEPLVMQNRLVRGCLIPVYKIGHPKYVALVQDITAAKMAEDALSKGRANFFNIVNKHTDGIIVTDASDIVQFINPAVEILLARSAEEIVGHPLEFLSGSKDEGFCEIAIRRENGEKGIAEVHSVDTKWQGHPAHLITLRDITHRKEWEKALEGTKQSADKANKAKSEFLANMSHELRSPLNAMLLLAQDLVNNKTGNLTDDQIESIHVIQQAGKSLLFLIDDILDLSKMEAGRMKIYIRKIRLVELADQLKSLFSHMAESKGLAFNISIEDPLPASIVTDHEKLEQILRNLVSNAVKFTAKGSIDVHFFKPTPDKIPATMAVRSSDIIAIAVSDTGIGIAKDKQKIIFDAFQQADGSTARKYGGTGLGLSISQKLSGTLGGHIQLTSRKGKGATFTLYLPKTIAQNRTNNVHADRRTGSREGEGLTVARQTANEVIISLTGKKIILMDQEPRGLFTRAKALENQGLRVHRAIDSAKALTILKNEPNINALVVALSGSEPNSLELIQKMKNTGKHSHLPIIVLVDASATATNGQETEYLEGAAEILGHTASLEELVNALDRNITS
jgi:PAS domain S-box-containing protein